MSCSLLFRLSLSARFISSCSHALVVIPWKVSHCELTFFEWELARQPSPRRVIRCSLVWCIQVREDQRDIILIRFVSRSREQLLHDWFLPSHSIFDIVLLLSVFFFLFFFLIQKGLSFPFKKKKKKDSHAWVKAYCFLFMAPLVGSPRREKAPPHVQKIVWRRNLYEVCFTAHLMITASEISPGA